MSDLRCITNAKDLRGKRVLIRLDVNVPIKNSVVTNDFRLKKNEGTLYFLQKSGAKIIIIGHVGKDGTASIAPVFNYMKSKFPKLVFVKKSTVDIELVKQTKEIPDGGMMILENLRKNPGEISNDPAFAQDLSLLCDIYVNEAFSVSHRRHASISHLPHFTQSFAGPLFVEEVDGLYRAVAPEPPFYLILGGAKMATKLPLVTKFIDVAESVFVYGALAHDIFKAKGFEIGDSVHDGDINVKGLIDNKKIILPSDMVVTNEKNGRSIKKISEIKKGDIIYDAGPESIIAVKNQIKNAATILWNGPLGNFEEGYVQGTEDLAMIVADSDAFSVVGGGDTVAAIEKLGLIGKFGFVSTGGGAMLEYLAKGTLVGIDALVGR